MHKLHCAPVKLLLALVLALLAGAPNLEAAPGDAHRARRPQTVAAGVRPEVEGPILHAIVAATPAKQVLRVEAATNGHRTIASIVYVVTDTTLDRDHARAALQETGWALATRAFDAAPAIDEVHLTGLGPRDFPRWGNAVRFSLSAAVSRSELEFARRVDGRSRMTAVRRVWERPTSPLVPPREGALVAGIQLSSSTLGAMTAAAPPRAVYRVGAGTAQVALSIDDGPVPIYGTLLLDTLRQLNVRATFFLIGQRVEGYPFFARAIADAGHEIGNHSYSHPDLTKEQPAEVRRQIAWTQEILRNATWQEPRYFRPPAGRYNADVLRIAHEAGLRTALWSSYPQDVGRPPAAAIVAHVDAGLSDGTILLLHQGLPETIQALPEVVGAIRRRGLAPVTVGALLGR